PRAAFDVPLSIRVLAFSRDGKQLLLAGSEVFVNPANGTGLVWDMTTLRPQGTFQGHGRLVLGGSFSPDGRRLATAGSAPEVKVWEVAKLPAVPGPVVRSAVPPPNRTTATAAPSGPYVERTRGMREKVEILSFAFSGDASRVVTGHESEL